MPPGSAFQASRDGKPELFSWTQNEDLLLALANLLLYNTHTTAQVASTKKIKAPKMIPSPRGDTKSSGDKQDLNAIARKFLDAQKG